jgi:GT2 family glycosyltransferase
MNVIFICVNYYNCDETIDFINSIGACRKPAGIKISVIVVENSVPPQIELLSFCEDKDWVKVLSEGDNKGYYGAASWALDKHTKDNGMPDVIIVSNTDLVIPDKSFLQQLEGVIVSGKGDVWAPSIISASTGKDLNPYMRLRPSDKKMFLMSLIFKFYYISITYQIAHHLKDSIQGLYKKDESLNSKNERKIYSPHGSMVIFKRSFFEKGGDINHPCFLYGEEIYIAEKALRNNIIIKYEPKLVIRHKEHSTTGWVKSRKLAYFQAQASEWAYKAFFRS